MKQWFAFTEEHLDNPKDPGEIIIWTDQTKVELSVSFILSYVKWSEYFIVAVWWSKDAFVFQELDNKTEMNSAL